jgi:hypothetical protein
MRDIPLRKGKPISATRGWLPKEEKVREWRKVGSSPLSPLQLQDNLATEAKQSLGFRYRVWAAA